jgi:hypothetical protein
MSPKQERVVHLLAESPFRELYAADGKHSGLFYVTDLPDDRYEPLMKHEVQELEELGRIKRRWPNNDGCYVLPQNEAGTVIPLWGWIAAAVAIAIAWYLI